MLPDLGYSERLEELRLMSQIWWVLAGVSILLLGVFAMRLSAKFSVKRVEKAFSLRRLHEADSAIASMEFLFVFFPFLMIVMTVWQLAFMFNARMHVGYSAYAAARSASVMISADLENEKEGLLNAQGQSQATKWSRIRAASVPGTIAISPGKFSDAAAVAAVAAVKGKGPGGLGNLPNASAVLGRMTLMQLHHPKLFQGTRSQRALVKMLYAERMTEVLINGKDHKVTQNLEAASTVSVTVNYVLYLNVPFVGRMMEATLDGFINPLTGKPLINNPYPSTVLTESVTMTTWPRKRAIEPCNQ